MKYFAIDDTKTVSKLEYIENEMSDFLDKLAVEKQENEMRKKPLPIEFNTRIYNKLELVMLKAESPMSNNEALCISASEFYDLYNEYCELCCWIESKVGIPYYKNKPEFCNYCAITTEAFDTIKTTGGKIDGHQMEAVNDIDTRIANSILVSAENAEIKSKMAEFRLGAKNGLGHRIQTVNNHEPVMVLPIRETDFSPISEIAPPKMPKQIANKKGE